MARHRTSKRMAALAALLAFPAALSAGGVVDAPSGSPASGQDAQKRFELAKDLLTKQIDALCEAPFGTDDEAGGVMREARAGLFMDKMDAILAADVSIDKGNLDDAVKTHLSDAAYGLSRTLFGSCSPDDGGDVCCYISPNTAYCSDHGYNIRQQEAVPLDERVKHWRENCHQTVGNTALSMLDWFEKNRSYLAARELARHDSRMVLAAAGKDDNLLQAAKDLRHKILVENDKRSFENMRPLKEVGAFMADGSEVLLTQEEAKLVKSGTLPDDQAVDSRTGQQWDSGASFSSAMAVLSKLAKESPGLPGAPAASAPAPAETRPTASVTPDADVDQPNYSARENSNNFAMIVGIEKYGGGLREADFARRDADAMRAHLRALGYPERNIMFLADQDATKAGLSKALNSWLPNRVGKKSTVFFYFSGHGAPGGDGKAYLVPADGDPGYLADTGYSVENLYEKLQGLKAQRVIVAMDACFSGQGGRSILSAGVRPLVTKIDTGVGVLAPGKVVALSSSKGEERSVVMKDKGHGAFTYYLLKGLNGEAKDDQGQITVQSLYFYLMPKVEDAARLQNYDQTPQMMPASQDMQSAVVLRGP